MKTLKEVSKRHSTKLIASFITFLVIGLLLLAGPARAFTITIGDFDDDSPIHGETISISFEIEIKSNERVTIPYVNLTVDGDFYCMFNAYNGSIIAGNCSGTEIKNVTQEGGDYGYGYGYAYGEPYGYGYHQGHSNQNITYNLTINTSEFYAPGKTYTIQLKTILGTHTYSSEEKEFSIGAVVESDNEIFEDIGFLLPTNETDSENISSVTTNNNWTIEIDTGDEKNSSVFIPKSTKIQASNGSNMNATSIDAALTGIASLSGLSGIKGALKFGIPSFGLNFSQAITISIFVGTSLNNETLEIWRSLSGTDSWTQDGLVDTNCTVALGICEFQTTQASYFAANDDEESTTSSSSKERIIFVSDSDFEKGYTRERLANQGFEFNVKGTRHQLLVNSVSGRTATVTVSSTPQTRTLSIGEQWKVNVDGDNYYDVLVTLADVIGSRARIRIQRISEIITDEIIDDVEDIVEEPDIEDEITPEEPDIEEKLSFINRIIIAVVALIILLVVIIFFMKKKDSLKKRKR